MPLGVQSEMANQFFVAPPDLSTGLASLKSGYDFTNDMRKENEMRMTLADLGRGIQNGTVDYTKMAGRMIAAGQIGPGMSLLQLGQQYQNSADFNKGIEKFYGGGGAVSPAAAVPSPGAAREPLYSGPVAAGWQRDVVNTQPVLVNHTPDAGDVSRIPSPLDPPSGKDRDAAARIVLAEAAGEGPTGMQAVANVVRNRAAQTGLTPGQVITERGQFEPVGSGRINQIGPTSPGYNEALAAVDRAYMGDDPTRGAVNFYGPKSQAALAARDGRPVVAKFDNGQGVDIGNQRFFTRAEGPTSETTDISAQARQIPGGAQSTDRAAFLMKALVHPGVSAGQKELAKMLLAEEIKVNPEIQKFEAFQKRPDLYEMYLKSKQAGATAVTVDNRLENEEAKTIGKGAGERAVDTMKAAGAAPKNLQNLARMESLLAQVNQGRLEPGKMTIAAWGKALGVDEKAMERLGLDPKGLGTQQAVNAMANELAIGKIGPGGVPANNFSDADRNFLTDTMPRLANDPEGNALIIEASRRLAKLDIEKAREWQRFRTNNKGKSFDDFETQWNDKVEKQEIFSDLRQRAQQIVAASPRNQGQQGPALAPDIDALVKKYAPR